MSETAKYRHLTVKYCKGSGIDVGCGSEAVVPNAIAIDLPEEQFSKYRSGESCEFIHLRGYAQDLKWFKDGVLDFVYSSHLLEDFDSGLELLREWMRVLKPGGHIVILVPDKKLWNQAVSNGQPPNCAHRHEYAVGELSSVFRAIGGVDVIEDKLTALTPADYSILFVGKKR